MATNNNSKIVKNATELSKVVDETMTPHASKALSIAANNIELDAIELNTIIDKNDLITARNARNRLKGAGLNDAGLTDAQAILVAVSRSRLKSIDDSSRAVSLVLGALSATNAYMGAIYKDGKAYKSEGQFLKAFYPDFQISTLQNYATVGRLVYFPISQNQKVHPAIKLLASLSPSTLQYAVSSLTDDTKREKLFKQLMEGNKNGVKLTTAKLREYNKAAKEEAGTQSAKTKDNSENSNVNPLDFTDGSLSKFLDSKLQFYASDLGEISMTFSELETEDGNKIKWDTIFQRAVENSSLAIEFIKVIRAKYKIEDKLASKKRNAPDEIDE